LLGGKTHLENIWEAKESQGIAVRLLYRGLEIPLGRIIAEDIIKKSENHAHCLQIPEEHSYLMLRDINFERFMNNLTRNMSAYEKQMENVLEITKGIQNFGASKQDGKHKLAPFVDSAFDLEKSLPHVELGSAWGSSGAATTVFANLLNFPETSKIYMISPLERYDTDSFKKIIDEHGGVEGRTSWLDGTQSQVPWRFGPVRSIYEDTIHTVESVSPSVVLISRYLIEGGLVSFHDARCPKPYPGLAWVLEHFRNSPAWSEVVYPYKEKPAGCDCTNKSEVLEGCNYMHTLRRRVTQPPLGVRMIVQGNPKGTTFKDVEAKPQYHELASFTYYQDFFE
jgi:hypothetical protein